jgi:hypothetical protein
MPKVIARRARTRFGVLAASTAVAAGLLTTFPSATSASPARSTPQAASKRTAANTCTKPSSVLPMDLNNAQSGVTRSQYYLTNDTWNAARYTLSQTLYVCDYDNWYVTANMNNKTGDGAVKTYPNVHLDFSEPKISSFSRIVSDYGVIAPGTGANYGIWEFAYDIWLNGVATGGSTELMIWTDNNGQTPSGSIVAQATFEGQAFDVWKSGSYIAFVAKTNVLAGQMHLLEIFKYVMNKGWIPKTSTIGQIDYGAELVSTNSATEKFVFNDFDITTANA